MRIRLLVVVVLAALAGAGGAAAAPPSDLSTDPLDRGVLLALPSVYRVTATVRIDGLRTRDGVDLPVRPRARRMTETGTAVAVAPGGWLVTAGHVGAPDGRTIARLAHQSDVAFGTDPAAAHADEKAAYAWVDARGIRPVGTTTTLEVAPADTSGGGDPDVRYPVTQVTRSARGADLALLRIRAPAAPALALDESESTKTPIATIGFGRGSAFEDGEPGLEPAIRRGAISRVGYLGAGAERRRALAISAPVQPGDSGGPVVDTAGRLRGIVIIYNPQGGVAERATDVRQLLDQVGVTAAPGEAGEAFRGAMDAFWDLDFARAEQGFDATLAAFPAHTLAGAERRRVQTLSAAGYALGGERRRGVLLAIGIVAAIAALACAVGLATPALRRGGSGGTGR